MSASTYGRAPASSPVRYTLAARLMQWRAYRELVHMLDRHIPALRARLERCYEYDAVLVEQEWAAR